MHQENQLFFLHSPSLSLRFAVFLACASALTLSGCEEVDDNATRESLDRGEPADRSPPLYSPEQGVIRDQQLPDRVPLIDARVLPEMLAPDAMLERCEPGEIAGCVDITARRICGDDGESYFAEECAEGERCSGGLCVMMPCFSGELTCLDEATIGACRRDQSGFIAIRSCAEDSPCVNGACASPCSPEGKTPSNIGCEYWSVDLDNYPDPFANDASSVPHAVAISNTSERPAQVNIEGPVGVPLAAPEFVVEAGAVSVYTFPRLDIDGSGIFDRAFKITATQPVIVYQFNPLNNEGVASNDASLLLPTEGLGTDYIGASWPSSPIPCFDADPANCLPDQHGYLTVVATSAGNTTVRVTPTANVMAGDRLPAIPLGEEREITLSQGEVLNLQAEAAALDELLPSCMEDADCGTPPCVANICIFEIGEAPSADLTGTLISASQPVAVFGGHEQAVVGEGGGCCAEHLEQQLLPVSSWGDHYIAARSEPRGGSMEHWRVIAQQAETDIQTSLNEPENRQFTLGLGEFKELVSDQPFELSASAPVMLVQYLVSGEETGASQGDPAMIIVPPTSQLRARYQIITPSGYARNWLTVAKSEGASVSLDGIPIDAGRFMTFGSTPYALAWIEVNEGVHLLEGSEPFALTVYGYSGAVSYGYPGGLNLRSDEDP
ncbi:MAG: IgGFc-binding protein [Myxococcota bacterium]|nr:IgGFc-binding protein [Myxococcota bacterium]